MITAILSSFNERDNAFFWQNLDLLRGRAEVRIVDGGSTDGTLEKLAEWSHEVLPDSNRAQRYNRGIARARGEIILLVHPRSLLSAAALEELATRVRPGEWGAFRHSFDEEHPLLRFTSWYSNFVRGRGRSIFYLDHCLFFTRQLIERARFPEVALFEDTYFCVELRRVRRARLLRSGVVTSWVRFRQNGLLRQSVMNQVLKIMFLFGASEAWMARVYEKGLRLNNR